jgi:hypothetical protein
LPFSLRFHSLLFLDTTPDFNVYPFFTCDTTIYPLIYVLLFDDCLDVGLHGSYEGDILGIGFVLFLGPSFCIIALHTSSGE